ncbi:hypothetical protein HG536_0E04220 [Torulaspora globosa]|uniref:histone acetyltransferase n=1 Tax=Torulaspora globosa TaxID=48254 RepID=A0A7G3ZJ25_9SACH|nr:uncharacterized protein HG536_0E04220 [Torulaspora globosa]QLL33511.1 hypothetical protein HG536_0E04220 [Torulaspora globosa]
MFLNEALKSVLPEGQEFETLHLRSPPIECHPLVTKQSSSSNDWITVKAQHFFILFHNGKTIFGLQIYVYINLKAAGSSTQDGERMIFISKADTTGHADCKVNYRGVTKVVIEYLLSLDPNSYLQKVIPKQRDYGKIEAILITKKTSSIRALRILSNRSVSSDSPEEKSQSQFYNSYRCKPGLKTKVCLFTRPAPQYLFPESSKNPKKRVIDGERLLRWWISILDDILHGTFQSGTEARLLIPGEDSTSIRRYLRDLKYGGWEVGDIFGTKDKDIAVYHVPLFPDDPKARFLRQLVEENRARKTTLETFWIELQNRQEFKLSVAVSVIGIQGLTAVESLQRPSPCDVVLSSRKDFNALKRYVTGEKYDTVAGAAEAYSNVRDYLSIRCNQKMTIIVGQYATGCETRNLDFKSKKTGITANTLQPRKKAKK